jgi:hypothetical protein
MTSMNMTSVIQDIQEVHSLRKELRDLKLPVNILNSIASIHNCIKTGTDLNGWKKVDWRGGSSKVTGTVSSGSNYGGSHYKGGSGNGGFFTNRKTQNNIEHNEQRNEQRNEQQNNTSHFAFNSRTKSGFTPRNISDTSASIPLVTTNSNDVQPPPISKPTCHISVDGFRTPPQKYVSKFKKSSEKVEDTILNTIILGKLNKFSEINYPEIKEFITHIIDSGQTEMIKCFMKLVFEKAASEEMFCPLYAKLLSELSCRFPVLLTEMANLYSVYMEIFEEVPQNTAENYNEVCKRNVEKKYRRGYSQFLAELIKHNVIDSEPFMKTINKIISQVETNLKIKDSTKLVEEYADCLMKIMKAIQDESYDDSSDDSSDDENNNQKNIEAIRLQLKKNVMKRILPFTERNTENVGLSTKARFTFLDIYENIEKF